MYTKFPAGAAVREVRVAEAGQLPVALEVNELNVKSPILPVKRNRIYLSLVNGRSTDRHGASGGAVCVNLHQHLRVCCAGHRTRVNRRGT